MINNIIKVKSSPFKPVTFAQRFQAYLTLLCTLAGLHALFTATLKYRARHRELHVQAAAVTTADSVRHRVITFSFFSQQCSCLNERD